MVRSRAVSVGLLISSKECPLAVESTRSLEFLVTSGTLQVPSPIALFLAATLFRRFANSVLHSNILNSFASGFQTSMKAVVKLGGALFKRDPDVDALRSMGKVLSTFASEGNQLVAVAGGGQNARVYIDVARKLGADESTSDLLGITVTRANAELFRLALGSVAVTKIPTMLSELTHYVSPGKVVVIGGLQPGQSTNAVAALAAEITHADFLVNATDVQGVYTADPKKDPKAKLLRSVSVDKLLTWAMTGDVYAGKYELLDPVALKIMQRARIPTRFVSMEDPSNITSALRGRDIGTLVSYS